MGGQYVDGAERFFSAADTTLSAQYLRVKLSGDHTVTAAGASAEDDIGVNLTIEATAGLPVGVRLHNGGGTRPMVAAGAITQNALVYPAASGKISATASGEPLGRALEAASGNNSVIEVLVFSRARGPRQITDPGASGAIPVTHSGACNMTSAGAETRTIAAPTFDGQRVVLNMDVDGGDITLTVASAANQAGNNTLTFGAIDDCCELVARRTAGVLKWCIGFNDGVALSTV